MRPLHGIVYSELGITGLADLKRTFFLFDKFHVIDLNEALETRLAESRHLIADFTYLMSNGVVESVTKNIADAHRDLSVLIWRDIDSIGEKQAIVEDLEAKPYLVDKAIREVATELTRADVDAVALYQTEHHGRAFLKGINGGRAADVLEISLSMLPAPNEDCPWEELVEFKHASHDKLWGFRRFTRSLASSTRSEAEIKDDIEWSLNEYRKAVDVLDGKRSQTAVDVFVLAPLEIIENLLTFNWSKIARGALQVRRRRIDLLEAELKAPGRECAYVFDAHERFGRPV